VDRVPHVRTTCPGLPWSVHGPKMVFSNAFCSLHRDADLSNQPPFARMHERWRGLRPIFLSPCTLHGKPGQVVRTWGTRLEPWTPARRRSPLGPSQLNLDNTENNSGSASYWGELLTGGAGLTGLAGDPPNPDPLLDPLPEPLLEPKPEPLLDPKPEPLLDPKPDPLLDPNPDPELDPKPVPLLDPKPVPVLLFKPVPVVLPFPFAPAPVIASITFWLGS